MPAANYSVLAGRWTLGRLKSTVINDIAVEVFFFTAWAAAVTLISHFRTNLGISPQILTVLGTVLGLVISFRTSSAYDRYWEGRKLWSTILLSSRNLGHMIWIHVPIDRNSPNAEPLPKDAQLKAILEKKTMVNLVRAFSVAVKHYLRGEGGIYYEDLYPDVCFLPRHASLHADFQSEDDLTPLWHADAKTMERTKMLSKSSRHSSMNGLGEDIEQAKRDMQQGKHLPPNTRLLPSQNPPKSSIYDYLPILLPLKPLFKLSKRVFVKQRDDEADTNRNWIGKKTRPTISAESNVPLEICLFLSSYLNMLLKQGLLQPAIATGFTNNIGMLLDSVTALERIRSTPIPFAYQLHLRMTIWLYLFFLPFQIYLSLHWITIPATAFASFLFLGFLEIGAEIENPFDYDSNDLDLDAFCTTVKHDLAEITAHPVVDPTDFIFSQWNSPLMPADPRTADQILKDVGHDYHDEDHGLYSVRRTLMRSWRDTMFDTICLMR